MKPYGIKFVGPVCAWGCCWKINIHSGRDRRIGHGLANKKRVRVDGKREVAAAIRERGS